MKLKLYLLSGTYTYSGRGERGSRGRETDMRGDGGAVRRERESRGRDVGLLVSGEEGGDSGVCAGGLPCG